MNLLKRFVRNDNADFDESYDENELYVMPEDIQIPDETANSVAALENPARKDPEFRPANDADKVSLKLLQPKSHIEATKIADTLKEGCIVLLDISRLTKEQAHRLVDFHSAVDLYQNVHHNIVLGGLLFNLGGKRKTIQGMDHCHLINDILDLVFLQRANKMHAQIFAIECVPMLEQLLHAVFANIVDTEAVQIVDVLDVGVFDRRQKRDVLSTAPL